MIIKKTDIENFGKFSGHTVQYKPGFNLIFGKNEDGKSTLMAFIKLLFYGGSSGKSSDISKNLRKKYTPWNGAPMSGAAEFESDGQEFRLHKEFKKSAASDKLTVSNLTLGEKVALSASEEMGDVFFDMELGEFERSVFIESYGGFNSDASGDSLAMRIANLSVSGDEGYSQSVILSRISAAQEELISKSGKKGLIVEAQSKLDNLKARMEELSAQTRAQFTFMADINRLNSEIAALEADLEALSSAQKVENAKKDLKIFSALAENFKNAEVCNQKLGKYNLSVQELESLVEQGNLLKSEIAQGYTVSRQNTDTIPDSEYNRLVEIEKQIQLLNTDRERIESSISSARKNLEQSLCSEKKRSGMLSWIFMAVVVLLGIGITVLSPSKFIVGGAVIVAGILLSLLYRMYSSKNLDKSTSVRLAKQEYETALRFLSFHYEGISKKATEELLDECSSKIQEQESIINHALEQFGCSNLEELSRKTNSAQNSQYTSAAMAMSELKSKFALLVSQAYPAESFEQACMILDEIHETLADAKAIERDINTLSQTIVSDVSPESVNSQIQALQEFIGATPIDEDALSKKPSDIKAELFEKRRILGELQSKITIPEDDENQLSAQIAEEEENLRQLSDRYTSLKLVSDAMDAAVSEMNKGLGSRLSQKTGEYLSLMSGGKYADVMVSRDLSVETRNNLAEGYHQWKYLSAGAIDRVYLALRLAATDIIAEKHNPLPLFLDDILAQYDDENCKNTLSFLKKYLEESGSVSQILFFTCHKHIAQMAKEIIPDLNEISL